MASEERLYELETALDTVNWGIVGLSEVRRLGEMFTQRKHGNMFYYYGSTKEYRGVGFYIHKDLKERIEEVRGISKNSVPKIEN